MPTPLPVNLFQITVTFDASTRRLSFSGEDIPNKTITIPQGIGMISFQLETINNPPGMDAGFQTVPIQWLEPDGLTPMPQPNSYVVQWFRPKVFTLTCFNSVVDLNTQLFNIVVLYDGKTYGDDPTIVTQPPDGVQ